MTAYPQKPPLTQDELVALSKKLDEAMNAKELKAVHDWTKTFERHWSHQIDRIKERAERMARERSPESCNPDKSNKE